MYVIVNEKNKVIRSSDNEDVINEQLRQLTESGQKVSKKTNITS